MYLRVSNGFQEKDSDYFPNSNTQLVVVMET